MYEKGQGVAADLVRAREFYEKACDGALAQGCFNLGLSYERGAAPASDEEIIAPFQRACDLGHPPACTRLANVYDQEKRQAMDGMKAVQLYQRGCYGGDAPGCVRLGVLYGVGKVMPRDLARAAQLFQKGCDGGEAAGCCFAGDTWAEGLGVPKDQAKAEERFKKACDGGSAVSGYRS